MSSPMKSAYVGPLFEYEFTGEGETPALLGDDVLIRCGRRYRSIATGGTSMFRTYSDFVMKQHRGRAGTAETGAGEGIALARVAGPK
jgi:hypothetical protein